MSTWRNAGLCQFFCGRLMIPSDAGYSGWPLNDSKNQLQKQNKGIYRWQERRGSETRRSRVHGLQLLQRGSDLKKRINCFQITFQAAPSAKNKESQNGFWRRPPHHLRRILIFVWFAATYRTYNITWPPLQFITFTASCHCTPVIRWKKSKSVENKSKDFK